MARDILSEYGPDSPSNQKPRATNGGQQTPKEMPYSPPKGPTNINDGRSPGLHGTVHDCGTQGKH